MWASGQSCPSKATTENRGLFLAGFVAHPASPSPAGSMESPHSAGITRSEVERRAAASNDADRETSPDSTDADSGRGRTAGM
ncbi:hypothetical protein AAFF_G00115890 [Aldrovandia affinis]|uniref:Uncharacterized protein n=1 Tax=Aldrovandia affinis TaxID=143900 RepID=A0AAD7T254_9TELE|nr:hypothetical protein AAFF_G00115890 [Aldrovandia affinis]